MDLKDMQKEFIQFVDEYNKKHKTNHTPEMAFHHLVEEVGELSREIQKNNDKLNFRKEEASKEKLSEEISDIICQCLILARDYNLDVEEAFKRKIAKWNQGLKKT